MRQGRRRLFGCVRHVKVTGCVLVRAFGKMGLPRKQWRQQSPFQQSCCKHHVHWQHMGGSVYSKTAKPAQLKVKLSDFEMLDGQGGRWGRADATASMLATVFQQHNSSNNFRTFIRLMLIFVARPLAGQGLLRCRATHPAQGGRGCFVRAACQPLSESIPSSCAGLAPSNTGRRELMMSMRSRRCRKQRRAVML